MKNVKKGVLMDGFWSKAFRWINIVFIPGLLLLLLGIGFYKAHYNEPLTNSPIIIFLVVLLFILMIAGKIRRNFTSGSFFSSRGFMNLSYFVIAILGLYIHHFWGIKGLIFEGLLLLVLVLLIYGVYKFYKRKRD